MQDDLKELLQRDPFVSFRIVLTSEHEYEVQSPYQVAIGKSQLNYYYPRSDRWAILRLNQIASYDVANGAAKRGRRR